MRTAPFRRRPTPTAHLLPVPNAPDGDEDDLADGEAWRDMDQGYTGGEGGGSTSSGASGRAHPGGCLTTGCHCQPYMCLMSQAAPLPVLWPSWRMIWGTTRTARVGGQAAGAHSCLVCAAHCAWQCVGSPCQCSCPLPAALGTERGGDEVDQEAPEAGPEPSGQQGDSEGGWEGCSSCLAALA